MRIKTVLKWLLLGLSGIVGLVLLGVATIYVLLGNDFSRTFDVAWPSAGIGTGAQAMAGTG